MFNKIATIKDIAPQTIRAFELKGKKIALANIAGKFFAIDDLCTHEECSLGEGDLEGNIITCPCHGSQFDLTNGKVLTLPAVEDVRSYPLKQEGEDLLVEM